MKVGILSNEQYTNSQKNSVGSSRMRCTWVLNHWKEAEEFKIGQKYDVVIYQKAYFKEHMKLFEGVKILDLCDPDWLEGKPVVECAMLCDAVTVSSEGLYDYLSKLLPVPVYYIPDTVDMGVHKEKKVHVGRAKSVSWFGYQQNQKVLDSVLPTLRRLGLTLTVISDQPYYPQSAIHTVDKAWVSANVKNIRFDPETLNEEIIAGGDFTLNNRPNTGKFYFKSDNKTIIAWALGMPVARSVEDVERFMDELERKKEVEMRLEEVRLKWTVSRTIREYTEVIRAAIEKRGLNIAI